MSPEFHEFSLSRLEQLSKDSLFPVAQRHYRELARRNYFERFRSAARSFSIPQEGEYARGVPWETLESYTGLPFIDTDGNSFKLYPSRSNAHNGFLTVDFQSTHPVTNRFGDVGTISGHVGFDEKGRLVFGFQNRFTDKHPIYVLTVEYEKDGTVEAVTGICKPIGEESGFELPTDDMPFFKDGFLSVDVAEVMRQSR